jgi:glycosyltransferase involved in cell wall biosynthesis
MVILLFGQHFAEYILTVAAGFPADQKVFVCLNNKNYLDEIPDNFKIEKKQGDLMVLPMPGPGKPYHFFKSVLKFRKLLLGLSPDIIHFQEMPKGYTFVCWLLARRYTRILTVHDVHSHPGGDSKSSIRQDFFRKFMRKSAAGLIVHGQKLFDLLQELDPALAVKTKIIPHPAFRVSGALQNNRVIEKQLLFFGRISKYKGLKYLIEACIMLQEKGQQFSLVVAGKGDDFEANKALLKNIKQLTIVNRHILPMEINDLFSQADIIVLPYIEASQSGVTAYALGFGKPCVASRIGSIPEMVINRLNGLLSEPADSASLASCLEELLENRELKHQYSLHATELATTVFSPATVAQTTLNWYQEISKKDFQQSAGEKN